jgi:hypothetical protein
MPAAFEQRNGARREISMTILSVIRVCLAIGIGVTTLALGACMVGPGFGMPRPGGIMGMGTPARQTQLGRMPIDMGDMQAKQQLMQDLMSDPDLPVWHDQRQKIALASGDRQFDKSFDEVYEGMMNALATLGSRVSNTDRVSGYITGTLPDLGPERNREMQNEQLAEYVKIKGYPDSVLDRKGPYGFDPTTSQKMMSRMGGSGLTLTMVHQSAQRTKVKLRFDNVYYPPTVQELYRTVWTAVDKQMFLDKALDH